jgi:glycosyltransferase involved in cell wall biosynthesis
MNVLMILETDFPPDIRVENEINSLAKAGFSLTVVCPTQEKDRVGSFNIKDVDVQRFYMSSFIYKTGVGQLKFPFYYNFFKKNISRTLQSLNKTFDVVHSHDLSMAKIGLYFANQLGAKAVLDLHENYPYLIKDAHHTQKGFGRILSDYKKWITFEKNIVKSFKNIITVVEEMKERMLVFDNRTEVYHVYQNVINSEDIPNYSSPNNRDSLELIYVGGITPARGIQTVINAISLIPSEIQISLNIYGKGIYQDHLKNMVTNLNLSDKVHFKGFIDQSDVIKTIQDHDIALIPHYRSIQNNNSSPNKLFQYMSTGRAVISSNCDSIERVIKGSGAGITYSDKNSQELSKALIELSENPERVREMGEKGFKAVKEKFNTTIEGQKLSDFYKKLS